MRGTRTRQPNSGLVSNHDSSLAQPTVEPTTASDGNRLGRAQSSASTSPRVLEWVRWSIVVPCSVTATGVSRPAGGEQVAERTAEALGGAEDHDGDVVGGERDQSILVSPPLTTCSVGDAAERQRHAGVGRHGRDGG